MPRPNFLLCEIKRRKPLFPDSEVEDYEDWIPFETKQEADDYIAVTKRPGFGREHTMVKFQLYRIGMVETGDPIELEPISMLEVAHEFGGHGVKIGLQGSHQDGAAVFWDSRHNSFVLVKPPTDIDSHAYKVRLYDVSDQGVLLFSINGIGEIRWSVTRSGSTMNENKEAVAHFGLTWTK